MARSASSAIARARTSAGTSPAELAAAGPVPQDRFQLAGKRRLRSDHPGVQPWGAHQALAHEHPGEGVVLADPGTEPGEDCGKTFPGRSVREHRAGGGALRHGLLHHG
jgi:hypothetical protein